RRMGTGTKVAAALGGVLILCAIAALIWYGRQPAAWQIPRGVGWYCYATATSAQCVRSAQDCVRGVERATYAMVGYARTDLCRPQQTAWCFTQRIRWSDVQYQGMCFPTRERCEPFR